MAHICNNGTIEFAKELSRNEAESISTAFRKCCNAKITCQEGTIEVFIDDLYSNDFPAVLKIIAASLEEDNSMNGEIDYSGTENGVIFIEDGKITPVDIRDCTLYRADREELIEFLVMKGYRNPDTVVILDFIRLLTSKKSNLVNNSEFIEFVCKEADITKEFYEKLLRLEGV